MQSPEAVATAVGRNVRALRQQRRMTIDALAAASGVSRGTVIQIETARGNPSIGTLCSLAAALRVGVASLVDGDAEPRIVVRRGAEAAQLWTSAAGSSAVFRIGTDPPDVVELWDWTLQPGDGFEGEAHPIGTQEVLSVLAGRLALRVGVSDQGLDTGDTVLFQAHAPPPVRLCWRRTGAVRHGGAPARRRGPRATDGHRGGVRGDGGVSGQQPSTSGRWTGSTAIVVPSTFDW
jgi:transcriptional regulator with XRE-family HTH domain